MKGFACIATTLVVAVTASAATIQVDPVSSTIPAGVTLDLNVNVTDVTDLYAYQFDLTFDPFILSAISVSEGPFLSSGGTTLFVPGMIGFGGAITFTANTLLGPVPGVSGSGTLATISFLGGPFGGVSPITLSNIILLNSALVDISAEVQNGSVTVLIPEPSSGLLLGSVIGFVLLGRYRLMHRLSGGNVL